MVRENLVTAATAFLSSPSVMGHEDETKRKFLLEKGLTSDEIIAAFAKSRGPVEEKAENFPQIMDRCLQERGFPKNKSAPTRPSMPLIVIAAVSTATLGIIIYLYRLFRRYTWPWIVGQWRWLSGSKGGPDTSPGGGEAVEMKEIVTSQMYELHDTISTIKSVLDQQQSQIQELAKKDPEAVVGLRKELESIKKLLLSKDSFPQPVSTQLPAWQIRRHDRNPVPPPEVKPKLTPEPHIEDITPTPQDSNPGSHDIGSDDVKLDSSHDLGSDDMKLDLENSSHDDSSDSDSETVNVDNKLYSQCLAVE